MKFELGHSRLIDWGLLFAHSFAALMVGLTALPLAVKIPMIAALALSVVYYLRRNRGRLRIELDADNVCLLQVDDQLPLEYSVLPLSFVASYLVILRLRHASERNQYVIIAPDRLDAETFRRLRVFLRWGLRLSAPAQH